MNLSVILALMGVLSLLTYTVHAIRSWKGIPPSLSDAYYRIKRQGFFTLALAVSVFATLPPALEISQPKWQFLVFLSMVGMLFVAIAPRFRTKGEEVQRKMHITGAAVLFICATVWSTIHQSWSLFAWFIPLNIIAFSRYGKEKCSQQKKTKGNVLFWIEVAVILQLYITLFVSLLKTN